ncbi:cytochrome c peroxidase [Moritella viscosa]|uniref:cytochrome c peroxidase n=1 Tax=Moritella viscosa TaxID=80854 RepID=UPI0009149964|nr:cytochrome c peroxidase [Moritella viscosa]SHO01115.1 Cytochrome-c peroxidase [Moritella viscosa]SHO01405.1 Cytochrome-c peroxidase [Moritella viscosa]SHO05106.1 Cytochrome-c peroxidase [Moritella viscosa]
MIKDTFKSMQRLSVIITGCALLAACGGDSGTSSGTGTGTGTSTGSGTAKPLVLNPSIQLTQGRTTTQQYVLTSTQELRLIQPGLYGNASVQGNTFTYQANADAQGSDHVKLAIISSDKIETINWLIRVNKPTPRFATLTLGDSNQKKEWQCLTDNNIHQGVVWGSPLQPSMQTYAWGDWQPTLPDFQAQCQFTDGDGNSQACTTDTLVEYANQQNWCGRDDWRLPSDYEMKGLISEQDYALDNNQAAIDPYFFSATGFETYWLANDNPLLNSDNIAPTLDFATGRHTTVMQNKRKPKSVMLVSGVKRDATLPSEQKKPQAEKDSFIRLDNSGQPLPKALQAADYADAPWRCLDDTRGLVRDNFYLRDKQFSYVYWLTPDPQDITNTNQQLSIQTSVPKAVSDINQATFCGRDDWRLPTADELAMLLHKGEQESEYSLLYETSLNKPEAGDYWVKTASGYGLFSLPTTVNLQPKSTTDADIGRILLIATEFESRATEDPRSVNNHAQPNFNSLRQAYANNSDYWPTPFVDDMSSYQELGTMPKPSFPNENPYSELKVALGEKLFFDPFLSRAGDVACSSCHDPKLGWGDGQEVSIGHDRQRGKRNAPTIVNSAFLPVLFWDSRAATLEQQALMPIQDPVEMAENLPRLLSRLNAHTQYPALFKQAFPEDAMSADITEQQLGMALATFQRTIISNKSRFDTFVAQADSTGNTSALSDKELWGLDIFRRNGRCVNCHMGAEFTDHKMQNVGLTYYQGFYEDLGLYNVDKKSSSVGKFKTPSLRDVMNNHPWFHNGLLDTMEGIISMYSAGMADNAPFGWGKYDPNYPVLSKKIRPLNLTVTEAEALKAFLTTITAPTPQKPATRFELGLH